MTARPSIPEPADILAYVLLAGLGLGASLAASPGVAGLCGGILALMMLAIAISDRRHFIIPNALTAPAFLLGLFAAAWIAPAPVPAVIAACLRAALSAVPLLALMLGYQWLRGRPGLGMGDVKLAAVAGAWLDWFTVVGVIELAALATLVAYVVARYALRRPLTAQTALPFGLFFAPAIWIGWLVQAVVMPH